MDRDPKSVRPLPSSDLSWMCGQAALVLRAGIPLGEGLSMVAASTSDRRAQATLERLAAGVADRQALSAAMASIGGFPGYAIDMVKVGEYTGNLDKVLENLSDYFEKDDRIRKRLRGALVYPVVLLAMMAAIVVMLVVEVLPVFRDIFASLGGELPGFSAFLLDLGDGLVRTVWIWLPILAAVVAALVLFFRLPRFRRSADAVRLGTPFLAGLYKRLHAARFSLAMGYLLGSGCSLEESIRLSESVVGNQVVADRLEACRRIVAAGGDPFEALGGTGIFPPLFVHMLSLGNRTGELDGVMRRVSRLYEEEVDASLRRITGIVEPLLVTLLSLVVGTILLSVLLPLIGIMTSIG